MRSISGRKKKNDKVESELHLNKLYCRLHDLPLCILFV